MKKRLKVNGFLMFLAVVLIAIFPGIFLRGRQISYFDAIAEIFGIAFIILGQLFRASARGYKAENSKEGQVLLQGGPYVACRNPMYLGILLIGLGIVLVLFNWWVAIIFLLIFSVRYVRLIFNEEKKLLALFPKIYVDYQKKVPRLLPSLIMLSKAEISQYLPLKVSWLKKEIGSILTVLLITLFIESWEDIGSAGGRAYMAEAIPILVTIASFIILIIYLIKKSNIVKDDG